MLCVRRFHRSATFGVGFSLALLLLVLGGGCKAPEPKPLSGEVVAKVGETLIPTGGLRQELARRGLAQPTDADKAAVLEDLIRFEVLYANARQGGFDQKPEVQAAIKRLIIAQYRESLETNRRSPTQIAEAEIADYYRRHADRYGTPEQVRAAMVFLPVSSKAVPEKRAEARQKAEELRAQAGAQSEGDLSFGLLAQHHSAHQPTRYRGGDLGWQTQVALERDWEPAIAKTVFALAEPGAISPVIEGQDGLYLFKLMERKPATMKPLAEVREGIVYQLNRLKAEQASKALYGRLKERIPIEINQAALDSVATNRAVDRPPGLPGR